VLSLLPPSLETPALLIGPVIAAAGMLWLSRISPGSQYVSGLLGPGLLTAAGFGLSVPAVTLAATNGIPRRDAGLASGLLNTNRQVGASIGLAALATIAADRTAGLLAGSGSTPARIATALTHGYGRAFAVAVFVCLAASAVAWRVLPSLQSAEEAVGEQQHDRVQPAAPVPEVDRA